MKSHSSINDFHIVFSTDGYKFVKKSQLISVFSDKHGIISVTHNWYCSCSHIITILDMTLLIEEGKLHWKPMDGLVIHQKCTFLSLKEPLKWKIYVKQQIRCLVTKLQKRNTKFALQNNGTSFVYSKDWNMSFRRVYGICNKQRWGFHIKRLANWLQHKR